MGIKLLFCFSNLLNYKNVPLLKIMFITKPKRKQIFLNKIQKH